MADKSLNRIRRQFEAIGRFAPPARRIVASLTDGGMRRARIPVAVLLILGGFFAVLPIAGFWMLPLGILFLAMDIPVLRPRVAAAAVLSRRWFRRTRAWLKHALERR